MAQSKDPYECTGICNFPRSWCPALVLGDRRPKVPPSIWEKAAEIPTSGKTGQKWGAHPTRPHGILTTQKARPWAAPSIEFSLYIQNIKFGGVNVTSIRDL